MSKPIYYRIDEINGNSFYIAGNSEVAIINFLQQHFGDSFNYQPRQVSQKEASQAEGFKEFKESLKAKKLNVDEMARLLL